MKNANQKTVELGDRVRDRISGFDGIVTGIHKWLNGCERATISGRCKDGGSPGELCADIVQLEVIEKGAYVRGRTEPAQENDMPDPAGPRNDPRPPVAKR